MNEDNDAALAANEEALPSDGEAAEQQTSEIEARAARMGWVPEDEFRGDSSKWTTAEDYVRRAEEKLPVMRAQLKKYDEDNERYEKANAELKKEIASMRDDFKAFHKHYQDIEKRSYEQAKADIKAMQRRAVEEADSEAFNYAEAKLEEIEKQQAAREPEPRQSETREPDRQQTQQNQEASPAVLKFVKENPWFEKSPMLNGAMLEFTNDLIREKPYLSEDDLYAEAKQRVVQAYPDRFPGERQEPKQNMKRSQAAAVASSNGAARTTGKKEKTFDDLPDEAKAEFTRFASRIPGYTKEEYVKAYRWST